MNEEEAILHGFPRVQELLILAAEAVSSAADEAYEAVRTAPREVDSSRGRLDPQRSIADAAGFASSLGYAAGELRRKAERIETEAEDAA